MSQKWKTLEEGIRVRSHATRKHGIKPDTYFTLRIQINGKRTEESLGWASEGMTLAKARLELARLKEAVRSGTGPTTLRERKAVTEAETVERQSSPMTIGEFWDRHYYPEALRRKKSAKSEEKLFRNWIRPQIGNLPLNGLKKSHIDMVVGSIMKAGLAPRTAQYAVAVVSLLWNTAFAQEFVTGENPARRVRRPKIDNRRLRFLSKDEADALLAELKNISLELHDECVLALYCGLRAGEILLFPTATGKKRVQVSRTFGDCVEKLGLNAGVNDPRQRVVFHTLRHTFASWLVQKGVPLHTVAELMGHRSIAMTQRYAHLSPESLRNAVNLLQGA